MKVLHKIWLKKTLSSILAAAMSLSLFTTIPVSADIGRTTYNYDGYSVDYNVTNEWDGAQTVELTVSNTGTDSILNWALKYDAEGEISNLWNAELYEQDGDECIIKNVGWNFEIAPSQSITYGYTLSGNDLALPNSFEIYSKRVDKTESYDIQYNITKSWNTGVEGNIVITNTSTVPIEAWTLSFDSNFTIDNFWNGRVLESNGTSYTVAAEMWTNPVQPNGSMTIGFVGSKAADVEVLISNFRLTEVVVGEGGNINPNPKLEIAVNAVYDEENRNITVSWTSNNQDGTFDILMSEDGENFLSVDTVESISEFIYNPENDFETLYFKVIQIIDEQTAESNVIKVKSVDWEDKTDTDNDGITDVYEKHYYKTDPENPDTDGDGLHDGYEVYTLGTNPLKIDSDDNGISDAYEDFDEDGLSNIEEYQFKTSPLNKDTDNDGLSDYEEVNTYNTDPLKYDTDDDKISDGDEIIIGLDPNNTHTFTVPDNKYVFEQKISEELLSKFNDNNEYHINIDVNAAGYAEHAIAVGESGYTNSIKNNDIFVGKVLSVTYADLELDTITLSFNLNDDVITQNTDVFYDELKGINRFQVVRMNSDNNMLEPVKTEVYDSTLIVEATQTGDYSILDVSKLLAQYNVEISNSVSSYSLKSGDLSRASSTGPIDVVFMVDCSNTNTDDGFKNVLKEIEIASEIIFDKCYDARISIIRFAKSAEKIILPNGSEWATNIAQVKDLLSKLNITLLYPVSYYGRAQEVMFNSTKFRSNAVRFGFSIISLPSYPYTGGDKNAAKELLANDIKWGYICPEMSLSDSMEMKTNYGITLIYESTSSIFGKSLAETVCTTTADSANPYIVLGYNLEQVKLMEPLSKNSTVDSDGDGLSDSQEINWDKYDMKTMYEFLANTNQNNILSSLTADERDELMKIKIYPAYSNPTMADSDGDGFFDGITGKYEPTGYYKVADKWPLTDKPHPAFYQKGGEYYFNKFYFPITYIGRSDGYGPQLLNLTEDEQKYIYKLCEIANENKNNLLTDPLMVMAICAHESSCEKDKVNKQGYCGYMQVYYDYSDDYCYGQYYNGTVEVKKIIDKMYTKGYINDKELNILKQSSNYRSQKESILKRDYIGITFGVAMLCQCLKDKEDLWLGLRCYCSESDTSSPYEDVLYRDTLAHIIGEEMLYENKTIGYWYSSVNINGVNVKL